MYWCVVRILLMVIGCRFSLLAQTSDLALAKIKAATLVSLRGDALAKVIRASVLPALNCLHAGSTSAIGSAT